jgi:hypothetical protein
VAFVQAVEGVLVHANRREYDGFVDASGVERPGGVIREVMISQDFSIEPARVRVDNDASFAQIAAAGFGAFVSATGTVSGVGKGQHLKATTIDIVQPALSSDRP